MGGQGTNSDDAGADADASKLGDSAVSSKTLVITGGPGVGKTTLVNAILRILVVKGVSVALAAPTGRAAKRLSESTGMEAKTIHRLLEVDPRHGGFKRDIDNPLDCDLLVVDETSMVDVPLMASLVQALPNRAALRSLATLTNCLRWDQDGCLPTSSIPERYLWLA